MAAPQWPWRGVSESFDACRKCRPPNPRTVGWHVNTSLSISGARPIGGTPKVSGIGSTPTDRNDREERRLDLGHRIGEVTLAVSRTGRAAAAGDTPSPSSSDGTRSRSATSPSTSLISSTVPSMTWSGGPRVRLWLSLFNTATLPFYWGGSSRERGAARHRAARRDRALVRRPGVPSRVIRSSGTRSRRRGCSSSPLDEVERLQRERIRGHVGGFAGSIDTWDAINEAVIMPVFEAEDNAITRLARGARAGRHGAAGVRGGPRGEPGGDAACSTTSTSPAHTSA